MPDRELMEAQEDHYLFDAEQLREQAEQWADDSLAPLPLPDNSQVLTWGRAWAYHDSRVRADVEDIEATAQAEMDRIEKWREGQIMKATSGPRFLSNSIHKFLVESGQEKLETPYFKAKMKQGSERTEVADPKAFCELHGEDSIFVSRKVVLSPVKGEIKNAIKKDKVEVDGAEIVRGPDSFQIEAVGGDHIDVQVLDR